MECTGFAIDRQVLCACRFTRHHHRREPIIVSMRAVNEEQQMSEVLTRLVSQYPSRDPAGIARVVERAQQHFAASPIRDFVPLLVERRVRTELSAVLVPSKT